MGVEKRKNHKVTVIRNVEGDAAALIAELKNALGAGGVARGGEVEIQGDHEARVVRFLSDSGRVNGVSNSHKPRDCAMNPKTAQTSSKVKMRDQQQQPCPPISMAAAIGVCES